MDKEDTSLDISSLCISDKENTHPDKIIEKDGRYFVELMRIETDRITRLCERAENDSKENTLPEEACGRIRTAIGKSQLLLTKKFKQFEGLCKDNMDTQSGKKRPTSADLEGFWDLVAIQIEDINNMFSHIDEMRKNNWKDSLPVTDCKDGSPSPGKGKGKRSPRSPRRSPVPKRTDNNNGVNKDKARKDARQRLNDHIKAARSKQAISENGTSSDDGVEIKCGPSVRDA